MPFHMFERESESLLQRPDSPHDFGLQFAIHQRIRFRDKEIFQALIFHQMNDGSREMHVVQCTLSV